MYNKFIFFRNNKIYYYMVGAYLILLTLSVYFYKNIGNYEQRLKNLLLSQTISAIEHASNNILNRMLNKYPDFIEQNYKDESIRHENEDRISDLLNDDISSVYILYFDKKKTLFYLLDASKKDRGESGEPFEPIDIKLFLDVKESKESKIFVQPTINNLGFSLVKPITQNSKIIGFLVLDYKEGSIATLSSLLNVSVKSLIYAILFSLFVLFLLISYIIHAKYIKYRMYVNPLTDTFNKVYLTDNYEKIDFKSYYIALVDVDFFKRINNLYGHKSGDVILINLIKRIRTLLRENDMFIQYGGDEFLLFIHKEGMEEDKFKIFLESIRRRVESTNFIMKNDKFSITVSIGSLIQTELEKSLQDAIHKTDRALYKSKHSRRNCINYFDMSQPERIYREELKEMIESDKLVCYYQPIKSISNGTLHHYEALLRIEDGDNIIYPDKILPLLEDSYLYSILTKKVIEYNLKILRMDSSMIISINLSADDLINDSILYYLIENSDLSSRIFIEILETKSIDYTRVEESIQKLKLFGFKICIDDFGSGYSNLSHLLNLSIDYLKIDGTIIQEILNDKRVYSIVKTFALFSKENNIDVIAEFIDSKEILDTLKALGIEYGQGWYFAKAKPYHQLEHLTQSSSTL